MIIDFNRYNGGGGSGSGVTPQDVQAQINSALTPYWESGETKDYVDGAVSGISLEGYATSGDMQSAFTLISETQQVAAAGLNQLEGRIDELSGATPDLSAYYTSAQTEAAIAQAVSGLATEQYVQDAISGVNMDNYWTSAETQDAIDEALSAYTPTTGFSTINGSAITNGGNIVISGPDVSNYVTSAQVETQIVEKNYVTSAQVETQIEAKNYVNSGDVKSQVEAYNYATVSQIPTVPTSNTAFTNDAGYITDAAIENLVTSAQVETQIDTKAAAYTPTSGFSTINGSAITNGGNIVIEGGADMSAYYTSAQTEDAITSKNYITSAQVETQIVSKNYITSAEIADFVTSAQVETQITSKGYATVSQIPTVPTSNTAFTNDAGYVTSAQVETQIVEKNYITSAAIADKVSSTYVSTIWRGTQAEYDAITTKDPNTFYIIVNN